MFAIPASVKRLAWAFVIGTASAAAPVLSSGVNPTWAVVGGVIAAGIKSFLIAAPGVENH